jgi:hypothetical protein
MLDEARAFRDEMRRSAADSRLTHDARSSEAEQHTPGVDAERVQLACSAGAPDTADHHERTRAPLSSSEPPANATSELATAAQLSRVEASQRKLEARVNARMDEMANALLSIEAMLTKAVGPPHTSPHAARTRHALAARTTRTADASDAPIADPREGEHTPIGYGMHDA